MERAQAAYALKQRELSLLAEKMQELKDAHESGSMSKLDF
jgi:hypothetical protein